MGASFSFIYNVAIETRMKIQILIRSLHAELYVQYMQDLNNLVTFSEYGILGVKFITTFRLL
jgi:hypothetical protein